MEKVASVRVGKSTLPSTKTNHSVRPRIDSAS